MRDLLFLAHRLPYPPDKGDRIRSFHILQYLASRFRVHLGCFSDHAVQPENLAALRILCAEVFCLTLPPSRKISAAVRAQVRGTSISEEVYFDRRMARWVKNKIVQSGIGDAFVFCSAMFPYIREFSEQIRVVTDLVDVDSQKWGAYGMSSKWPLSAVYRREQRQLLRLEKEAVVGSTISLFVSQAEADCFGRLAPGLRHRIAPLENGVDLQRFSANTAFPNPFPPDVLPVVFTGMMDYWPNIDAVNWFSRKVMPGLQGVSEAAEFWIVGARPDSRVRQLSCLKNIRVTGAVPDVRPYLAHSVCAVAPLRIARGVQNKVLEAMAMAKPAVVTPQALEGLSAVPNSDLLVASTPEEFVEQISEVISGKRDGLGASARLRVENDYNWARKLRLLDNFFVETGKTGQLVSRSGTLAVELAQ